MFQSASFSLLAVLLCFTLSRAVIHPARSPVKPSWVGDCRPHHKAAIAARLVACMQPASTHSTPTSSCRLLQRSSLDSFSFGVPCRFLCPSITWFWEQSCLRALWQAQAVSANPRLDVRTYSRLASEQFDNYPISLSALTSRYGSSDEEQHEHNGSHQSSKLPWIGLIGAVLVVIIVAAIVIFAICMWKRKQARNMQQELHHSSDESPSSLRENGSSHPEKLYDSRQSSTVPDATHEV